MSERQEIMNDSVTIDGVKYVREQSNGKRAVVVVDRGWIFAGDVHEADGRIRLTRALHVFRWEEIGFAKMVAEPKSSKVDLRPCADVDMPSDAEIFRIPVEDAWGL